MPYKQRVYSEKLHHLLDQIEDLKFELAEAKQTVLEVYAEMAQVQAHAVGEEMVEEEAGFIARWKVDYRDRIAILQKRVRELEARSSARLNGTGASRSDDQGKGGQ